MPAHHNYLHRTDLRLGPASRDASRPRARYAHYELHRLWGFVWRWEATYCGDVRQTGHAAGKAFARSAARRWLRHAGDPVRKGDRARLAAPAGASAG